MKKLKLILGILSVSIISSCGSRIAPEFRIGVISYVLPQENPQSDTEGWSTDKGVELAVREINALGGVKIGRKTLPIRVVHRAIDEVPEEAVSAVLDLVNREKVSVILGPAMSSQAIAAGAAAEAAKVPLISSVSSNPATTAGRSYVFRMCFTDLVQAKALIGFASQGGGPLGIVYDESDPYSAGLAGYLKEGIADSTLLKIIPLTEDIPDFSQALSALSPYRQDYILIPAASSFSIKVAATLRSLGYRGVYLGADGWDREQQKALPDFEGALMTTTYVSRIESQKNNAFVKAYREIAGKDPGDTAALTYDSVYLVAQAARIAGSVDSRALRDAIAGMRDFTGVSGDIRFTSGGDPERSVILLSFSGGDYRVAFELKPAQ